MAAEFALIILAIFIIVVLIAFTNLQGRVSRLQLQIQMLQQRLEKLLASPDHEVATKTTTIVTDTTKIVPESIVEDQQVVTQQLAPDPITVAPVSPIETTSIAESTTLSRFKPISPQQTQYIQTKQKKTSSGESLGSRFIRWLIKGNPVAKVAIIILFFGIAYLLKYSIDNALLSPEIRILGALVLGLALMVLGWNLRLKNQLYALILQGGAIGILYLTIFAAFKYDFVPLLLAFGLLFIFSAVSILFAVLQRALSLATLASIGGYLAPILLSTGEGNYIALFSYYLLISSTILVISIWQSWRILNVIGFIFTYVVAILWGQRNFIPDYYVACQIFILANMLIYGILAVLLSIRSIKKEKYQNVIDIALLFSVPILAFMLQYSISETWQFGAAFSALGFGLFYLIGALVLLKVWQSLAKQLAIYGIAIGLGFATLAVPLALSSDWTALVWLLEGTTITWAALSLKQNRLAVLGSFVVILGLLSAIIATQSTLSDPSFITLYSLMSGLLLLNGCLWHHYRHQDDSSAIIKLLFVILTVISWSYWIIDSSTRLLSHSDSLIELIMVGYIVAVWLWYVIGKKLHWITLRYAVIGLWPVLFLSISTQFIFGITSYENGWWSLIWLVAFVSNYRYLYLERESLQKQSGLSRLLHISLFWIMCIWLYLQLSQALSELPWGFTPLVWSILTVVAGLIILLVYQLQKQQWFPVKQLEQTYGFLGLLPVSLFLLCQLIGGLYSNGQIIGLTYVPIINPLEESAILGLMIFALWLHNVVKLSLTNSKPLFSEQTLTMSMNVVLTGLAFLWFNSIILRCLSQWLELSWSLAVLWQSSIVQVALSLLWALSSVILITVAHRYNVRNLWFVGAILQGVVVIKLGLIDSVALDGLLRALAFIGVALLMLIIGYLAPLPPKQKIDNDQSDQHQNQPEL